MKSFRIPVPGCIVVLLAAFVLTACGGDSDSTGVNRVRWNPEVTVHPDREGAAVLLVEGKIGTPWTAEITSGEEWVSFDRFASVTIRRGVVGTSVADRTQYVYYTANPTDHERRAAIRFTFEGEAPVELELVQFSTSSDDDVYHTGNDLVWPEIPARSDGEPYIYVTHFGPLRNLSTGAMYTARNFTLCFDASKRAAWWVAYPVHQAYLGSGRVETWAYDPKLEADIQADLSRSYTGSYQRGHQCPNADRNVDATMQAQTFYYSNMTPQNGPLNTGPWARLESRVRDWKCSDTLYVVTGAYWRPGNTVTTTDRLGQICPVPTNYFKVLVRTVEGDIRRPGDRLGDYAPDQLKSIGFWVANASNQGDARQWVRSVAEIEQLAGFEFFPTLPDAVKQQKDPLSWGL